MEISNIIDGLERLGQGAPTDAVVLAQATRPLRVRMTCLVVAPDQAPQDEPAEAPGETPDDGESQAA
ncbi:hypothetical protein [Lysobacter xanthus]